MKLTRTAQMMSQRHSIEHHIKNLQKTLRGLHVMVERNPTLYESIMPQAQTINKLQSALCDDLGYTPYQGFFGCQWKSDEYILTEDEVNDQFWNNIE